MKFAFFGSSLVSAYWNGAATYYRGIIKAMYERGHQITFYEPDAYDRQKNRDIPDPWYGAEAGYHKVYDLIEEACDAIIKNHHSTQVI